jgi:hypothetical protein
MFYLFVFFFHSDKLCSQSHVHLKTKKVSFTIQQIGQLSNVTPDKLLVILEMLNGYQYFCLVLG